MSVPSQNNNRGNERLFGFQATESLVVRYRLLSANKILQWCGPQVFQIRTINELSMTAKSLDLEFQSKDLGWRPLSDKKIIIMSQNFSDRSVILGMEQ